MTTVSKKLFGTTKKGEDIYIFTLINNSNMTVELMNYGATLISIKVPDKNNKITDVLLGYDELSKYENQDKYLGATVGRCANRIENAEFIINGQLYKLNKNDNNNHLHGGIEGFNKKVWDFEITQNNEVKFFYTSPDMEENYPGELKTCVTYSIENETNTLKINYNATSNKDTICNLTNHSYFNLDGFNSGSVLDQYVQILADYYTQNTKASVPDGKICSVKNTPLDFRLAKKIGQNINSNFEQIKFANGFDNNWIINNYNKTIKKAACAYSLKSGIKLEVSTDLPGIQFYSGNYLGGDEKVLGKSGVAIDKRCGFCLECQYFPNAFKYEHFEKPVLKANEIYNKTILYSFTLV